jgi:UDP-glucose 4-epimerase
VNVLVTGGAGYVGSHLVAALLRAGHEVVVVDDLSTGHRDTLPDSVTLCPDDVAGLADCGGLGELLRRRRIEAVVHMAARSVVSESFDQPLEYYETNVGASMALVGAMVDARVTLLVFSSSAAVYGPPSLDVKRLDEGWDLAPASPYGETKRVVEDLLASTSKAFGLRYVTLRYFNAAGAEPEHGLGERHEPETHLIPGLLRSCLGGPVLTLHGTDYATVDGTAVRDYVHVSDVCDAHLAALGWLESGGASEVFNVGTGHGHSVGEVVAMAKKVVGREVPMIAGPRRPGDAPRLVADVGKAERLLGWRAKRTLEDMVRDAWAFHSRRKGTP